jgi:hypothetical protein
LEALELFLSPSDISKGPSAKISHQLPTIPSKDLDGASLSDNDVENEDDEAAQAGRWIQKYSHLPCATSSLLVHFSNWHE